MSQQYVLSNKRVLGTSGNPMSAAELTVFEAGTSTLVDSYSDEGFVTPNTNPIVADSSGVFGNIFLKTDKYKFILKDATGAVQWTQDNYDISGGGSFTEGLEVIGSTVRVSSPVSNQVGTSYTVQSLDRAKLITHTNANPVAVGLPQANSTTFPSGWFYWTQNRGVGDVTITPVISTIDDVASVVLKTDEGLGIFTDGTNYFTFRGQPKISTINEIGNVTITSAAAGDTLRYNGTVWVDDTKATQANMEAQTVNKFPDSEALKYHPGVAKAWCNFNGTGTPAFNSNFNCSSITDNGAGDWTVNLSITFSGNNHYATVSSSDQGGSNGIFCNLVDGTILTTSVKIRTYTPGGSPIDKATVTMSAFGDLV